jgi:hypothetical protein
MVQQARGGEACGAATSGRGAGRNYRTLSLTVGDFVLRYPVDPVRAAIRRTEITLRLLTTIPPLALPGSARELASGASRQAPRPG